MAHTQETKQKIGQGVKRAVVLKKAAQAPSIRKAQRLSDGFAKGHPDGLRPTVVRNYGDLGVDFIPDNPKLKRREDVTLQRREEPPPQGPIEIWKRKHEGEHGGKIQPPTVSGIVRMSGGPSRVTGDVK